MITSRFPLFSLISGSDSGRRVSVTEASDSGETLMAGVNNSELEQRQTASVVPLSFPVALQLLLRGYTAWIWGWGGGGAAEGEEGAATCCFSLFCLADLTSSYSCTVTEKHRRACETAAYRVFFWRKGWILTCVCSFRYGRAEPECSALPGWSDHYAHVHNHDALQPES